MWDDALKRSVVALVRLHDNVPRSMSSSDDDDDENDDEFEGSVMQNPTHHMLRTSVMVVDAPD